MRGRKRQSERGGEWQTRKEGGVFVTEASSDRIVLADWRSSSAWNTEANIQGNASCQRFARGFDRGRCRHTSFWQTPERRGVVKCFHNMQLP